MKGIERVYFCYPVQELLRSRKMSGVVSFKRPKTEVPNREDPTMSEFTFLFRGSDPSAHSPEQMQKSMQKWLAWFKELGEKGHIKYPGHPLERTGKVVTGKQKNVHDGPYAEAKDIVNGFTLIEADDLPQAVELSKGCPILEVGGSVEVRPVVAVCLTTKPVGELDAGDRHVQVAS
jgi:hypothetical protein